jgi:hypothetical protein
MSKTIVTFVKNWRGYAAGETAGFDETVATGLLDGGYAAGVGKEAEKKDVGSKGGQKAAANKDSPAGTTASAGTSSGAGEEGKP